MPERLERLVRQVLDEVRALRGELRGAKQELVEVKADLAEFKTEARGDFAELHRELGLVKAAVLDTARRAAK